VQERTLRDALAFCGFTHPKVLELLAMSERAMSTGAQLPTANNTIGSRKGVLSELMEGGSQLREIRRLAGDAFVAAMESVSPGEPQAVFAELMRAPSFRHTYLPKEWRDGLTTASIQKQMLETPFVAGMVTVYHELRGFRAKRQHLALFAPHFSVKVCLPYVGGVSPNVKCDAFCVITGDNGDVWRQRMDRLRGSAARGNPWGGAPCPTSHHLLSHQARVNRESNGLCQQA
jgi:hypothetical protein